MSKCRFFSIRFFELCIAYLKIFDLFKNLPTFRIICNSPTYFRNEFIYCVKTNNNKCQSLSAKSRTQEKRKFFLGWKALPQERPSVIYSNKAVVYICQLGWSLAKCGASKHMTSNTTTTIFSLYAFRFYSLFLLFSVACLKELWLPPPLSSLLPLLCSTEEAAGWPFWGFRAWHKSGHSPLPRPRRDGSQDVEKIQFKAQTDFFFNKDFGPR